MRTQQSTPVDSPWGDEEGVQNYKDNAPVDAEVSLHSRVSSTTPVASILKIHELSSVAMDWLALKDGHHALFGSSSSDGFRELTLVDLKSFKSYHFSTKVLEDERWPEAKTVSNAAYHSGLLILVEMNVALSSFSIDPSSEQPFQRISFPNLPVGFKASEVTAISLNQQFVCIAFSTTPWKVLVWKRDSLDIVATLKSPEVIKEKDIRDDGVIDIVMRKNCIAAVTPLGHVFYWDDKFKELSNRPSTPIDALNPAEDRTVDTVLLSRDSEKVVMLDLYSGYDAAMILSNKGSFIPANNIIPPNDRYLRVDANCQTVVLGLMPYDQDIVITPQLDIFSISEEERRSSIRPLKASLKADIGKFFDVIFDEDSIFYLSSEALMKLKFGKQGEIPVTDEADISSRYIALNSPCWDDMCDTKRKVEEYEKKREALVTEENGQSANGKGSLELFDARVITTASQTEKAAAKIVEKIKNGDIVVYQNDNKTVGDSFLKNVDSIENTQLFKVARKMPKGAHLHCHYNACLDPSFLIEQARGRPSMCIKSTLPLTTQENKDRSEIAFQVYPVEDDTKNKNIFNPLYKRGDWMRYNEFCAEFDGGLKVCEKWLRSKMVLNVKQVYENQTLKGIWDLFAIGTRMMKGLFGYESAFRAYTQECIQSFIDDNIQWAEIRPNFPANILWTDDGKHKKTNREILEILREEAAKKVNSLEGEYFGGWKVIYCCPRSFSRKVIADALEECIQLYLAFPDMICGFDLVGPEFMGHPLRHFVPEFLAFRHKCGELGISEQQLPFIFHAGETTENGGSTDGNLYDALLLKSKRIGHGFALAQHLLLMQKYRDQKIALEICPISNEILHLCSRISEHSLTSLLANNVPCTLSCDNSTYFSSSLSHDFYQVMIGSETMTLYGWRVLAEWSLEHSCMDSKQKSGINAEWENRWKGFCQWIIDTYAEKYQVENREE